MSAKNRMDGKRGGLRRLWKVLAYLLGVVVFLGITAVVTLDVALNRPRVKEAVEGWLKRSTGVDAGYERLKVGVFPPAIVAQGLRAESPDWGVTVDGVEVRLQVLKREIGDVVVKGVRAWGQERPKAEGEVSEAGGETPAKTEGGGEVAAGPEKGGEAGEGGIAGEGKGVAWGKGFVVHRIRLEKCSAEWRDVEGRRLYGVDGVSGEFTEVGAERPLKGDVTGNVPGGGEWAVALSTGAFSDVGWNWEELPVEVQVRVRAENLEKAAQEWGGGEAGAALARRAMVGADGLQVPKMEWNVSASVVGMMRNGFTAEVKLSGAEAGKKPAWKADVKGTIRPDQGFVGRADLAEGRWDGLPIGACGADVMAGLEGDVTARNVLVNICNGTVRAGEVSVWKAEGTKAQAIGASGVQGAGIELAEVMKWAGGAGADLGLGGRLFFSGEGSVVAGEGADVARSLKCSLQGKAQGLRSGVGGQGELVGRGLSALEMAGGSLLATALPGLSAEVKEWQEKWAASDGIVTYDVAEVEVRSAGDGRLEVRRAKVGAGGYLAEVSGTVDLAEKALDLNGAWAAGKEKALRLVGGDEEKLAWLPGGDDGSMRFPLTVSGTFDKVSVWPDTGALLTNWKESDVVREKVEKEVTRGLERLHSKDREHVEAGLAILQGLLGK